jgi:serine/threonine protein kinase
VSLYIATDLIDGTDVGVWSRNLHGSDGLERRIAVAVQLAQAVRAAHDCRFIGAFGFEERGVLHGDIKPANVLVERDSERVLLLDFMIPDIQRLLPSTRNGSDWRREGGDFYYEIPCTADFGTPGFMSPEQELDGTVSEASDIYSLGMTLSEIFWPSGRPLSLSRSMRDLDSSHGAAKDGERGDRAKALAQLIDAMTAPQARDRPRCMQDVLHALAAV